MTEPVTSPRPIKELRALARTLPDKESIPVLMGALSELEARRTSNRCWLEVKER